MKVPVKTVVLGCTAYIGGLGGMYLYFMDLGEKERAKEAAAREGEGALTPQQLQHKRVGAINEAERLAIFARGSSRYDSDIGMDETVMGINLLRRWLLWGVKGDVLEVGGGTGRNLDYYPRDTKLVLIDACEGMIQQTERKLKAKKIANVSFGVMDAANLRFKNKAFDYVVDTFGLCSYEDPVKALKEMGRVCREDGQVLLLEHGTSHYDWLNRILEKNLHRHIERWGCIWNRDIEQLVDEAGLEVVSKHRLHFGTTYAIVARPKSGSGHTAAAMAETGKKQTV